MRKFALRLCDTFLYTVMAVAVACYALSPFCITAQLIKQLDKGACQCDKAKACPCSGCCDCQKDK